MGMEKKKRGGESGERCSVGTEYFWKKKVKERRQNEKK